jgi:hypothetical protein
VDIFVIETARLVTKGQAIEAWLVGFQCHLLDPIYPDKALMSAVNHTDLARYQLLAEET